MTEHTPDLVLPACDFTVFGATGDLALYQLLPGLYHRERERQLPAETRILGVSRSALDDAGYRDLVSHVLFDTIPEDDLEVGALHRLMHRLHHVTLDVDSNDGWERLHGLLKDHERAPAVTHGVRRSAGDDATAPTRIYYLAVDPGLYAPIAEHLAAMDMVTPDCRVVLEKPIGDGLESSRRINDAVGAVFAERQIFRIDHYLGKEAVQNLLVTRFANTFLEPLWNSRWVDHVQITVAEAAGVAEHRAPYYEEAGALRDMVQNHLLQLLCLVAMEPPTYVGPDTVRDEKLKVLHALAPITGSGVDERVVRGQYASYAEGIGHPTDTETFVALRADIQNWRWAGVPFYLRTGKRMARNESAIEVVFKEPPHAMFPHSEGTTTPNRLTIRLKPDEGMQLHVTAKVPGPGGIRLHPTSLDLSYATAFDERTPDPYERLLMDVIRGIPTLFMRRDEVEAAWAWVAPILQRWHESAGSDTPIPYPDGTHGPDEAAALLAADGHAWQETP
ncbi:glucose-6-phosphate dehydrogenase [Nocardioides sp. BGMRC 2183]|nr:glucose-6-phosphate dehydrogenase [Nocardioides sp. BGMRC 2183]